MRATAHVFARESHKGFAHGTRPSPSCRVYRWWGRSAFCESGAAHRRDAGAGLCGLTNMMNEAELKALITKIVAGLPPNAVIQMTTFVPKLGEADAVARPVFALFVADSGLDLSKTMGSSW